jgi:hypothetical protein
MIMAARKSKIRDEGDLFAVIEEELANDKRFRYGICPVII